MLQKFPIARVLKNFKRTNDVQVNLVAKDCGAPIDSKIIGQLTLRRGGEIIFRDKIITCMGVAWRGLQRAASLLLLFHSYHI
jgi:hypothetical protein